MHWHGSCHLSEQPRLFKRNGAEGLQVSNAYITIIFEHNFGVNKVARVTFCCQLALLSRAKKAQKFKLSGIVWEVL